MINATFVSSGKDGPRLLANFPGSKHLETLRDVVNEDLILKKRQNQTEDQAVLSGESIACECNMLVQMGGVGYNRFRGSFLRYLDDLIKWAEVFVRPSARQTARESVISLTFDIFCILFMFNNFHPIGLKLDTY